MPIIQECGVVVVVGSSVNDVINGRRVTDILFVLLLIFFIKDCFLLMKLLICQMRKSKTIDR